VKKELKKKMVLCRETLLELDRLDVRQAQGGTNTYVRNEWQGVPESPLC
jgi:hypothetical protein